MAHWTADQWYKIIKYHGVNVIAMEHISPPRQDDRYKQDLNHLNCNGTPLQEQMLKSTEVTILTWFQ
eukprot:9926329-Ditylum_brightwellii.AAC.1